MHILPNINQEVLEPFMPIGGSLERNLRMLFVENEVNLSTITKRRLSFERIKLLAFPDFCQKHFCRLVEYLPHTISGCV